MTLGKRIAEIRKNKNLTQKELANILGISRASLAMYETNKREPDKDMLSRIADCFDVSVDYLFGKTDDPNPYSKKKISGDDFSLTKRDKKEISEVLENTKKQLLNTEGLMFDGESVSEEALKTILDAMELGMEMAKKKNKEKYTPKKYER